MGGASAASTGGSIFGKDYIFAGLEGASPSSGAAIFGGSLARGVGGRDAATEGEEAEEGGEAAEGEKAESESLPSIFRRTVASSYRHSWAWTKELHEPRTECGVRCPCCRANDPEMAVDVDPTLPAPCRACLAPDQTSVSDDLDEYDEFEP